jgi:hypothetical protein
VEWPAMTKMTWQMLLHSCSGHLLCLVLAVAVAMHRLRLVLAVAVAMLLLRLVLILVG